MPRIPVHTRETVPAESKEAAAELGGSTGRISAMLGELVHHPALVEMYAANRRILREHGSFDARTREAIALAMGAENACEYCLASHTRSGHRAGLSETEMLAIRAGDVSFDRRLGAMTAFVRDAAAHRGDVSDGVWQAALDAGWSVDDLSEAFAHIASNTFNNFFNRFARTELDIPAAPPLPR